MVEVEAHHHNAAALLCIGRVEFTCIRFLFDIAEAKMARAVTAVTRTASALLGTKQSLHVTLGAGGRERERERIYIFGGKQLIDRIGPRGRAVLILFAGK